MLLCLENWFELRLEFSIPSSHEIVADAIFYLFFFIICKIILCQFHPALTTIVLFQVRKADWAFMRRKQPTIYVVFMESGIRRSALCSSLLKILCLISIQDDAEGIWKIMANNRSFLFSLLSMGQVIYSYGNDIFSIIFTPLTRSL